MLQFRLVVGAISTNCYIIAADNGGDCAVIDPGSNGHEIANELVSRGLTPKYILSTHGHADHTGGVLSTKERLGGKFALGKADAQLAANPPDWLVVHLGTGYERPPVPDVLLDGGEVLEIDGILIEVIPTPGHTRGSVCYKAGNTVFSGDTLFKGNIGRYDLPGGDRAAELTSIEERLLTLADVTMVFPGHGPATTIGDERKFNPFLV